LSVNIIKVNLRKGHICSYETKNILNMYKFVCLQLEREGLLYRSNSEFIPKIVRKFIIVGIMK